MIPKELVCAYLASQAIKLLYQNRVPTSTTRQDTTGNSNPTTTNFQKVFGNVSLARILSNKANLKRDMKAAVCGSFTKEKSGTKGMTSCVEYTKDSS